MPISYVSTRSWIAVALASVAVSVAACGGSSSKPERSSNPAGSPIALSSCMRSHGVPNFPDPEMISGVEGYPGINTRSAPGDPITVDGITFSGPVFQAAVRTCKMFGGGNTPAPISESLKLGMIANARCWRKHGVDVPDPTFPASGGVQSTFGPGVNPQSPVARQAATACARVGSQIPGI